MFEKDEDRVEEIKKRAEQASSTFSKFVTAREKEHPHKEFVYLDIGTLQPNQVFVSYLL